MGLQKHRETKGSFGEIEVVSVPSNAIIKRYM